MTDPINRHEALFLNLIQPCCIVDQQGQVLAWNTTMHTLTEQTAEASLGQPLADLGKIPAALAAYWASASQKGAVSRETLKIDQQAYLVSIFLLLPRLEWAIIVEDQQATTDTAKKDLLYTVAHDLQNPLTAIKGYAELTLNVSPVTDLQKHHLQRIVRAVGYMRDLVGRLLDVAWIDSGLKPQLTAINLAFLANEIGSAYAEHAKERQVDLKLEMERVPPVLADDRRLRQVVDNLIGNAIKYSPNGGEVVVSVKPIEDRVQFSVQDHGIGIPAEYLPKIYERFYRVPNDYQIEGNGLGLAISYEILQKHGSTLQVESEEGKGSHFYFSLPTAR